MHRSAGFCRRPLTLSLQPCNLLLLLLITAPASGSPVTGVWLENPEARAVTGAVVTFERSFAAGEVSEAVLAVAGGEHLPTQLDVKSRHADGSVERAAISAAVPSLAPDGRLALELVPANGPWTVPGLSIDEALAHGFDAVVEVTLDGTTYSASAAHLLRRGATERWLDGPLVTEIWASGPLESEGRALADLAVLFQVRFLSPRDARVAIILEEVTGEAAEIAYGVRVRVGDRLVHDQQRVISEEGASWRQVFRWGDVAEVRVRPHPAETSRLAHVAMAAASSACAPDATTLCLADGRFKVRVHWQDFDKRKGPGHVVPLGSEDSGLFWFFGEDNWEMLIKVLDGCGVNQRFWVFAAASTNVRYTLTVTDTQTGKRKQYTNKLGNIPPAITDAAAFATCL